VQKSEDKAKAKVEQDKVEKNTVYWSKKYELWNYAACMVKVYLVRVSLMHMNGTENKLDSHD
jgi:hypothetical protein